MANLQPVRGTRDIHPDERQRHRFIEETARNVAARYGYTEISTPIFEFSEVFKRTLGDTSDIVTKEMYTFEDKGGDEITLRPEGTAGVARMLISGGLAQDLPLKYFYRGPMFRYERPQKGRFRQFHQTGIELLGVPEPLGDVEVIALGASVLNELGLLSKTTLELNTLGNAESRNSYREKLIAYFNDFRSDLSEDSQDRLERNPLRILDSKDKQDQNIVANAPEFSESLDGESKEFFAAVTEGLDVLSIAYRLNSRLVRGLDYYCHTAFEFTTWELGTQGTVLAGGRYDGLVGQMGGTSTAGVGWAAGIERLAMLAEDIPEEVRPIAIIPVVPELQDKSLEIAQDLRSRGFTIEFGYRGNMSRRLKRANKLNAIASVIIGPDELERGAATVRNLDSGDQQEVSLEVLADHLKQFS
ncbi:MAG: histidine--tRNA ligase [Rhodospirillaceae bacterium]|nr:histidine--tRNA ligase [Rhodospirillaceae bacterium]|tara:strand:- start:25557 stop:26801 length:1245 start_codon:yes stop_codon:yes gene_type:complete